MPVTKTTGNCSFPSGGGLRAEGNPRLGALSPAGTSAGGKQRFLGQIQHEPMSEREDEYTQPVALCSRVTWPSAGFCAPPKWGERGICGIPGQVMGHWGHTSGCCSGSAPVAGGYGDSVEVMGPGHVVGAD